MRIAILTSVFVPEFGVARVVASQLPFLRDAHFDVDLYACELDRELVCDGVRAVRVPTHLKSLKKALVAGHYDVIIAHTDPFFKFLAENDFGAVSIGYEHGYPPVELCLPEEREQRLKEIGDRLGKIYPALSQVVTISKYAAEYIGWPKARVIYNGADHYAKNECEQDEDDGLLGDVIKVLAVARFRKEEWRYKGLECLCRLKSDLGEKVDIVLAGSGDEQTSVKLQNVGVNIVGVVSDRQMMKKLYESSDVLVSFSEWETFNLPLAEAGFAHRPALALKLGPHEEVTPFTFESYESLRDYLKNSTRESLRADGERMFRHVEKKFRWKHNAEQLIDVIREICPSERSKSPDLKLKLYWAFWNAREFIRKNLYKKLKGVLCG